VATCRRVAAVSTALSHNQPVKAEFNVTGVSGLIATGLAANSVLFALRVPTTLANGEANIRGMRLKRLLAKWRTVAGFTVAQEVSGGAFEVSAFGATPADYTGGTNLVPRKLGPDLGPKPAQETVFQAGNISICTTTGMAHAGVPTVATQPFAYDGASELDQGTAATRGQYTASFAPSSEGTDGAKGLLFYPGTGFIIKNLVLHGAGGTGRLFVDCVWAEQ